MSNERQQDSCEEWVMKGWCPSLGSICFFLESHPPWWHTGCSQEKLKVAMWSLTNCYSNYKHGSIGIALGKWCHIAKSLFKCLKLRCMHTNMICSRQKWCVVSFYFQNLSLYKCFLGLCLTFLWSWYTAVRRNLINSLISWKDSTYLL